MAFAPDSAAAARRAALLAWLLLCVLVYASLRGDDPPAPASQAAPSSEFSARRAMQLLDQFATRPHPVGSPEHQRVQEYLFRKLDEMGLHPVVETNTGTLAWSSGITAARISNLIGRLPGTQNTRPVVLTAHYDSVDRAPGAGDDGGGVAAILETMRAIESGPALKNDVVVLLTDGEEEGLLGAVAAAAHDPWLRNAGVLLNFEGRGDQGQSTLFETSDGNRSLIGLFAKSVPFPAGSSLSYTVYKLMPNNTDFSVFRKLGIAGLNFAWDHRLEAYHSRLDLPSNLDPGSLQQHGTYALALTRAFGNEDLNRFPVRDTQNDVYFDWFGTRLVHYPQSWVLPLFGAATLLLVGLLLDGLWRKALTVGALFKGLLASFLLLLAAAATTALYFWLMDKLFGKRFLVGETPSNCALLVSVVLLAGLVSLVVFSYARSRVSLLGLSLGALVLVWFMTAALTAKFPLAGYLLFWPLVFSVIATGILHRAALRTGGETGYGTYAVAALVAGIPTILLFSPMLVEMFVAITLSTPVAVSTALNVAIGCLLLVPLLHLLVPVRDARFVILTLAAATAVLAGVGIATSRPSANHPMPDTLVYAVDGNTGAARWASYDTSVDPWTEQKLTTAPHSGEMEGTWGAEQRVLWVDAPRDTASRPLSRLTMVRDVAAGQVHDLELTLDSPAGNPWTRLIFARGSQILSATIDGEAAGPLDGAGHGTQGRMINLLNYAGGNVLLTLRVRTASCEVSLSDHLPGLPDGLSARPEDRMAWYGSDYTLVTRQLRFCQP